jgi:hypothetical protein
MRTMQRKVRSILAQLVLCSAFVGLGCGDGTDAQTGWDGGQADGVAPGQDGDPVAAIADFVDASPAADTAPLTTATITFRIMNTEDQTAYLRRECWYTMGVTSEADGKAYSSQTFCGCDCASASCQGTMMCGQCAPTTGIAVAAGQNEDIAWTAGAFTMQTKAGSQGVFQCVARSAIPTGTYRFRIAAYPTPEDAVAETRGKDVEQTFVLGTENATVEVPIR